MSNDRGFIALHRKIFENPVVGSDAVYFRAWIWLLCEAKYKPTRHRPIAGKSFAVELQRGQLSHSRRFIANALGLSEQRVRTFLNRLKIEGMILFQINQGQMVITICNYDDYQFDADENNQQINQQSTSNQPKLNKDNNSKGAEDELSASPTPPKIRRQSKMPAPAEGTAEYDDLRSQFMAYAAKKNLAPRLASDEFEGFVSHHKARGNLFADWSSAGQGWIRNAIKFASNRSRHQPGRRPDL
ncbi:MAG TPA: hypothetical protein VJ255_21800 [Candidatus Acidoferrum sp.]|jgi:hypothetical protein|nr:hypothetical protein [Candidatus Acidoferrum sp.]